MTEKIQVTQLAYVAFTNISVHDISDNESHIFSVNEKKKNYMNDNQKLFKQQ